MAVEHGRSEFVQPLSHGLLDSYTYNIIYFEGHRSLEHDKSRRGHQDLATTVELVNGRSPLRMPCEE